MQKPNAAKLIAKENLGPTTHLLVAQPESAPNSLQRIPNLLLWAEHNLVLRFSNVDDVVGWVQ